MGCSATRRHPVDDADRRCGQLPVGRLPEAGKTPYFADMPKAIFSTRRSLRRPVGKVRSGALKAFEFMYQKIQELYGKKLMARDGEIGRVKDFYFDDLHWAIRYLIVQTGSWLSERQVLLTPHAFAKDAFGQSEAHADFLLVNLTRKQIEDSPSIETHRPVSRQYEEAYYGYYGWPSYWDGEGILDAAGFSREADTKGEGHHHGHNQRDDLHLRSAKAVSGYHVQAGDETIGRVADFMVDGETWAIREIVVETGHWYSGKEVLLLPANIERIVYEGSTVFVNLTKEDIKHTERNEVVRAGAAFNAII